MKPALYHSGQRLGTINVAFLFTHVRLKFCKGTHLQSEPSNPWMLRELLVSRADTPFTNQEWLPVSSLLVF